MTTPRTDAAPTRSALSPDPAPPPARRYALAAAGLILAWAAANLLYLFAGCRVDLAPDEAHYTDWARHLDWCYYSKGPLVAWLIRGGLELFGDTAVRLTGTATPAVRVPAVVGSALFLAAIYLLSARTFRSPRLALATVALAMTVPPVSAAAVLMTIDNPFLCCWAWACVFAQRAATGGGLRHWAAAGAVSAVGVLAKYNMLLFPGCVGLFLLADRDRRRELLRPGFWVLAGLTAAGCLPILVWNATHEWVGFRHLRALAGLGDTARREPFIAPTAFPEYLAGQVGLLIGYWFLAWAAAVVAYRPGRGAGPRAEFLWWASVPVWLVFAAAAIKSRGQPNWPAAAYVPGLVLAVAWVARQVTDPNRRYRRAAVACLALAVLAGAATAAVIRFPSVIRPGLAALAGPPTEGRPAPVRKFDPTARLAGWRTLAEEVDKVRDRVRAETGEEPVLAAENWAMPGELGFYCRGRPQVYSFGPYLGDRHSQYDLWRPNPVADAQAFRGRTFVFVGNSLPDAGRVFDRVEPPVGVVASDGGVPVSAWTVWVMHGFRGFPADGAGRRARGY